MSNADLMEAWTLFDSPKDMPGYFVLRRFVVTKEGTVQGSPEAYWCRDIEPLRVEMRKRGLCCMGRNPSDEPQIVETWLSSEVRTALALLRANGIGDP